MSVIQQNIQQLDAALDKIEIFKTAEKKIGVPKAYLAIGIAGILVILLALNVLANLIADFIGFVYPTYASFQAIESPAADDDKKWLTYWVVFGFLSILENFSAIILAWLPAYYMIKVGLLIALVHPQVNGAQWLYDTFLRQFFIKNDAKIQRGINKVNEVASNITSKASAAAADAKAAAELAPDLKSD